MGEGRFFFMWKAQVEVKMICGFIFDEKEFLLCTYYFDSQFWLSEKQFVVILSVIFILVVGCFIRNCTFFNYNCVNQGELNGPKKKGKARNFIMKPIFESTLTLDTICLIAYI